MNKEHLKHIINKIEKDPDSWNQKSWHCGTTHCIAGHCQIELGKKINNLDDVEPKEVKLDAREYLEISDSDADYLFSEYRILSDFKEFLKKDGYIDSGYNKDGYNRKGFDGYGFNKLGYDKDGYDDQWFDENNKRKKIKT